MTAAVLAALILAPVARADQNDVAYLQELNALGLTPATLNLTSPAAEIGLAQRICLDLGPAGGGASPNELVTNMNRSFPNLDRNHLQLLVSEAVDHYCPNVLPRPLPWADPCYGGPASVDQQGEYQCRSSQ
ncbi:DUF732 domain-containing protein [Mycobacterium colombiense]|uniref:DUF732 domain-containing protein n=1 Tax=Mycobacterium colombiense TaxID=339268 RepID=UPI003AF5FC5A